MPQYEEYRVSFAKYLNLLSTKVWNFSFYLIFVQFEIGLFKTDICIN